jgi:hypothetical protein
MTQIPQGRAAAVAAVEALAKRFVPSKVAQRGGKLRAAKVALGHGHGPHRDYMVVLFDTGRWTVHGYDAVYTYRDPAAHYYSRKVGERHRLDIGKVLMALQTLGAVDEKIITTFWTWRNRHIDAAFLRRNISRAEKEIAQARKELAEIEK